MTRGEGMKKAYTSTLRQVKYTYMYTKIGDLSLDPSTVTLEPF